MARTKNRGLVYLRRSTEKQEISLPSQLDWALASARQHGVPLDVDAADLAYMQAHHLHVHKALRLDDGISGSDLNRPGFLAVIEDALADRSISHLFIYKRDRFARPGDAIPMVQVEKRLLEAGITLVFSEGLSLPYPAGQQDIARDIGLLFGYYQGGEELRKHAERVLGFQLRLAEQGFRTGGNAPYGFIRVLVDAAGTILETLPPGKRVQQAGCHVRVVPHDPAKIAVWLQILELKEKGWGVKRIASFLNDCGIPSPDAGRTRTDQGVKHRVTGKWNHNTVAELCRNPMILGIQRYGKRSEGTIRRLGAEGPRLLDDKDRHENGTTRIIFNDPSLQVRKQVGESQFEAERWAAIQEQMDERGRRQAGVRRAKDPARYPLACRLIDLTDGCGSILYGRSHSGRFVYTCGRYMRTSGAACASNQVDAEAMLRFTLKTLKQLVERHGNRDKLRQKLLERARREEAAQTGHPIARELAGLRLRLTEVEDALQTAKRRMAREKDDVRYEALAEEFDRLNEEQQQLTSAIGACEAQRTMSPAASAEQAAEAALGLLDDVTRVTTEPSARAEVNPLLQRLGVWIGLRFGTEIKGKKRKVQKLRSGRMTFGDRALPVPLFGKDYIEGGPYGCACDPPTLPESSNPEGFTGDVFREDGEADSEIAEGGDRPSPSAAHGPCDPVPPMESQPEGISITKVSRGDWIRTSDLLNPIYGGKSQILGIPLLTRSIIRRKRRISMGLLRVC